jgi:hypothetical protein
MLNHFTKKPTSIDIIHNENGQKAAGQGETGRVKSILIVVMQICLVILVLFVLVSFFGVAGIIIFLFAMALVSVWKGRVFILTAMRHVETTIWGKPLDKIFWKKGEMKNTKVKLVWKKRE